MAQLEALHRAVFPTARPQRHVAAGTGAPAWDAASPGEGAAPREVAWVRVLRSRLPAFEALEPGDLAIAPASAVAALEASGVEPAAIVEALLRAGAGGVVVTAEDEPGAAADRLLGLLAEAGVAAYLLPGVDPAALERSAIGYLVNERAELERQAGRLEAQLEALAIAGRGVEAQAAAIGAFLGRAVAVEGPRGEAVAVQAPAAVENAAASAARYLRGQRGVVLRVPLPSAPPAGPREPGPRAAGSISLLGDAPPTELERIALTRVAPLIALELTRGPALPAAGRGARRGDVLPADGPPWVALMARQVQPGEPGSIEERERLRERLRRLAPARRLALRGDAASLEIRLVAAAAEDDPRGLSLAERVAAAAGRPVAVSLPFETPEERPAADADARATLEAFELLAPGERPWDAAAGPSALVARADRLPAYRLLGGLHNLPDGIRQARLLLAPLLEGRPEARAERLRTLRAILDRPGLSEAAAALGLHRNTLAYRVGRIEARTGWRLDDPELRFVLALAVRLVQSAQD
ncbi:MAG TPA: helix-turn-helix domain-containing protein [Candidatus Limnocylindrales bacterium]|nr:helix-turn-helix domain-containing protein [Candidatus Limnocylindrales bacterium]